MLKDEKLLNKYQSAMESQSSFMTSKSFTTFSVSNQRIFTILFFFYIFTVLNKSQVTSNSVVSSSGSDGLGNTSRILRYTIQEGLPANTVIGNVRWDSGLHVRYSSDILNQLRFSFKRPSQGSKSGSPLPSPHDYFVINQESGVLMSSRVLDREQICSVDMPGDSSISCDLSADVVVLPAQYYDVIRISVKLVDINDNAPRFSVERVTLEIDESSAVGSEFSLPQAYDPDEGVNGIQSYRLQSDTFELAQTRIDSSTLDVKLRLKGKLDRETRPAYQLILQALDGGAPPLDGSIVLEIVVKDSNDNPPIFDPPVAGGHGNVYSSEAARRKGDTGLDGGLGGSQYEVEVEAGLPSGSHLLTLQARDRDEGENGRVVYRLVDGPSTNMFSIDRVSGEIRSKSPLVPGVYQLTVIAEDSGTNPLQSTARVTLRVTSGGNHRPRISVTAGGGLEGEGQGADAQITENAPVGTFVAQIRVEDPDPGPEGQVICSLINSTEFTLVSHYANEYILKTANHVFDRESRDMYQAHISCKDLSSAPVVSEKILRVAILDDNDHTPQVVNQLELSIFENNKRGVYLTRLNATDGDIDQNARLQFSLSNHSPSNINSSTSPAIFVNRTSGVITAAISFDYETSRRHVYDVIVSDSGDIIQRTSTTSLTITVLDINDESPRFTRGSYLNHVTENLPPGVNVGRVEATDADVTPAFLLVSYAFLNSSGAPVTLLSPFLIDSQTGEITTVRLLDREEVPSYTLPLVAYNEGYSGLTGSATFIIYVQDLNDNKPVFLGTVKGRDLNTRSQPIRNVYESHVPCDTPISTQIAHVRASDPDEGVNGTVSYHIVPPDSEFFIDPRDGYIMRSKTQQLTSHCGIYRFRVEARDGGNPYQWDTADVMINFNASLMYTRPVTSVTPDALSAPIIGQPIFFIPVIVSAILFVLFVIGIAAITVYCCRKKRNKREIANKQIRLSQQLLQQLPEHQQLLLEQLCRCKSMPQVDWDPDKDMTIQIRCSNDRIYRPGGIHRTGSNSSGGGGSTSGYGGGGRRSGSCYTIDLSDVAAVRPRGDIHDRGSKHRTRSHRLSVPHGYRGGYTSDIESDSGCSGSDCFDRRHTDEGSAATRSSPENLPGIPYAGFPAKSAGYGGNGTDSDSSSRTRENRKLREDFVTPYHVTGIIGGKPTSSAPYYRGQVHSDKEEMPMLLESSIE